MDELDQFLTDYGELRMGRGGFYPDTEQAFAALAKVRERYPTASGPEIQARMQQEFGLSRSLGWIYQNWGGGGQSSFDPTDASLPHRREDIIRADLANMLSDIFRRWEEWKHK